MEKDLDNWGVERAYARWAPIYDLVFGPVFALGRREAIAAAEQICGNKGGRILEVGVGTGLSLPIYSRANRIVGVDLCEPMLRQAAKRVIEHKLAHVETLAVMDAARLALSDASFDVVVAQFVVTALPEPEQALDEFVRVLKPGGGIILVNHFAAESGPRHFLERCVAPAVRKLGWRSEFRFARLAAWAQRHRDLRLVERRPLPPFGNFTVTRFRRIGEGIRRSA